MNEKVLESAYFHISNSGLTLKIVEKTHVNEEDTPTWHFHVDLNAFGTSVGFNFPLVPTIVRWIREALQRVETCMARYPEAQNFAFRNSKADVSVRDGKAIKDDRKRGEFAGAARAIAEVFEEIAKKPTT